MKILDTDHCIAILRGSLDLRPRVAPQQALAVTAISVGELTHGAHKSLRAAENLARLDVLLAALSVLPYDEACARRFGWLKAQLEKSGERLDDLDLQIASIALENNQPLVTHNQQHFARLQAGLPLQLEDWLS
mgnify:CR=1 FL=1